MFLQENEQRINDLFAGIKRVEVLKPETYEPELNEQLAGLFREYSEEIRRSQPDRAEMKRRVLALLDRHFKAFQGDGEPLSPIEMFETIGLLRVFATDAIGDGRVTNEDRNAFNHEWDVHGRGIVMVGIVDVAWTLARDDVGGSR